MVCNLGEKDLSFFLFILNVLIFRQSIDDHYVSSLSSEVLMEMHFMVIVAGEKSAISTP